MVQFFLSNKKTGEAYIGMCPCGCGTKGSEPSKYDTIEEAKKVLEDLNLAKDYTPRIFVDDTWKHREAARFSDGTYNPPVWSSAAWWVATAAQKIRQSHYCHVANGQLDKIAFTETPEKGMQDVQTVMSPGKYLKKFFGDVLSEEQIKSYAELHKEEWATPPKLLWAETPDEIEKVYTMQARFGSCMQKSKASFGIKVNPTMVYGAGDLALAYIVKGGFLIARALVWREKKLVGRVYGDVTRLRAALKDYGIETKSDQNSYDVFEGARLLKVPYQYGFIVPYVDGNKKIAVKEDYLYITKDGEYSGGITSGVIANVRPCDRCGGRNSNGHISMVVTANGEVQSWCPECTRTHAFQDSMDSCFYSKADYKRVEVTYTNEGNRTYASSANLDRLFFRSALSSDNDPRYYRMDIGVKLANGQRWWVKEFWDKGFTDPHNGKRYSKADGIKLSSGIYVCKESIRKYYVKIKGDYVRELPKDAKKDLFVDKYSPEPVANNNEIEDIVAVI